MTERVRTNGGAERARSTISGSAGRILARLALGDKFDPTDLLRYVVGVLPLAALHQAALGFRRGEGRL